MISDKSISTLLLHVRIALLLQIICIGHSLAQVNLQNDHTEVDLTNQLEYFVDSTKDITLENFLRLQSNELRHFDFPAFEPDDGAVWATTSLFSSVTREGYIIYFDQPILGAIDFWFLVDGKIAMRRSYAYTDKNTESFNRYPHFELPKFKGACKIILRMENSFFPINTLIHVSKISTYENSEKIEGGVLLLCFGISFVIIIYGCIFFLTMREKVYLWFLLYTLSMFIISLLSFGFARILFGIDPLIHNWLGVLMSSVALTSLILFVQDILEMRTFAKKLVFTNKIAIALSWVIFISQNVFILKIFSAVCVIYVFGITVHTCLNLKNKSSLFFLFSSTFAIAGILTWGLVNSGLAPTPENRTVLKWTNE